MRMVPKFQWASSLAKAGARLRPPNSVLMFVRCWDEPTSSNSPQVGDYRSCVADFQDDPGADRVDYGNRDWASLTREDLVRGAVATWKRNSEKNVVKEVASDADTVNRDVISGKMLDELMDYGVRGAGVVSLPACGDSEARKNWDAAYNPHLFKPYANYPCNA